jgi:hypothetical protein
VTLRRLRSADAGTELRVLGKKGAQLSSNALRLGTAILVARRSVVKPGELDACGVRKHVLEGAE